MERQARDSWWGCFLGSIVLPFLALFACIVVGSFFLDAQCANQIDSWLQTYPQAQPVDQTYNFIRPHAMGVTTTTLQTDAPRSVVRRWYIAQLRHVWGSRYFHGSATVRWDAQSNADGTTTITLFTECAFY